MDNRNYNGRAYAYASIALIAVTVILTGLSFTVMGIYSLIASMIAGIAAVTFANIQKRKNDFKNLIIIRAAAYVALAVPTLFFAGGLIWSID